MSSEERYEPDDPAVLRINAEDFAKAQRGETVGATLAQARRKWGMSIVRQGYDDKLAESFARQAISIAAQAFWFAYEDKELESLPHSELHKYGRWAREQFGCSLDYKDGNYSQPCPVAIVHKRMGFSTGGIVTKRICAICGRHFPGECRHRAGVVYDIEGGPGPSGHCRVCGSGECAKHVEGERYPGLQTRIVVEMELEEISLVRRPAQPLARLLSIPIEWKALKARLPELEKGKPVSCDQCLSPCGGFTSLSD